MSRREAQPIELSNALTSRDLVEGVVLTKELALGERSVPVETMTRIGGPKKKVNEDGLLIFSDDKILQVIVVDGGTQIEKVSSLESLGLTGGKYIATQVEQFGDPVSVKRSIEKNLYAINHFIGQDMAVNHPMIVHHKDSRNVPYGSIAGIKYDTDNHTLEIANAADVFAVTVNKSEDAMLRIVDDVRKHDEQSFAVVRRAAHDRGITFRQAMERTLRGELPEVLDLMLQTMQKSFTGEIRRINGDPNFKVTSNVTIDASNTKEVYLFSDGAIPAGLDIRNKHDLNRFVKLVQRHGIEGVNKAVLLAAQVDPHFEQYPRFRDIDDFMFVRLTL